MPGNSKNPPYNLHYRDGYYYFHTEQDVLYSCAFHNLSDQLPPVLGIYDIEISDFEFFPYDSAPEVRKPMDPRVSATVVDLLDGYFEHDTRVLIYLCDAADGRPKERQTLFKHWSRGLDTIEHKTLEIGVDEFTVYGGVLTRKDFPHGDVLKSELIDKASGMIVQKFGR